MRADSGRLLLRTSSWLSAKGTTSSAGECRMIVFGFTVVAVPQRFQAGHRSTSGVVAEVDIHRDCAAARTADHHVGMMLVILGLGDANGGIEIVVGKAGD